MTQAQYAKIHAYKKAAALQDPEYRQILKASTGKASSKLFTESDFDRAMAAIEAVLFDRVAAGRVRDPDWIQNPCHWRLRLPREGYANTRLIHALRERWSLLLDYLPDSERCDLYLAGIIRQATGRDVPGLVQDGRISWTCIPAAAAGLSITAINDRLAHAVAA